MSETTEQNAFRADVLSGKTAIVTGASRGIGAAIAQRLCEAGANVVLCSRSTEAVGQIADTLQGKGYTVLSMAADISERADVDTLIEKTTSQFSQIDILVNNAGITRDMLLMRLKDEDWDAVITDKFDRHDVLHPRSPPSYDTSEKRTNYQHFVNCRVNRKRRTSELCCGESGHHRFHEGYRERGRGPRYHGQCYRPWLYQDRYDSTNTGTESTATA